MFHDSIWNEGVIEKSRDNIAKWTGLGLCELEAYIPVYKIPGYFTWSVFNRPTYRPNRPTNIINVSFRCMLRRPFYRGASVLCGSIASIVCDHQDAFFAGQIGRARAYPRWETIPSHAIVYQTRMAHQMSVGEAILFPLWYPCIGHLFLFVDRKRSLSDVYPFVCLIYEPPFLAFIIG